MNEKDFVSQADFIKILTAQFELQQGTMNAITLLVETLAMHRILPAPLNLSALERQTQILWDALAKLRGPSVSIEDILADFEGPIQ